MCTAEYKSRILLEMQNLGHCIYLFCNAVISTLHMYFLHLEIKREICSPTASDKLEGFDSM